MPNERFFTHSKINLNEPILINEGELHHLLHVSRCKVNDKIEIINGQGQLAEAEILSIGKKEATTLPLLMKEEPPPKRKVILAQAFPRANRLDTILEKCTELGVTEIRLFPGEKSERKEASEQRIESILISALKQCGSLFIPKVLYLPKIAEWKELPCRTFFGSFAEGAPHLLSIRDVEGDNCIVIGPESGLTENEEARLIDLGASGASLHRNTLRTDTAAIVAVTFLTAP